MAINKIELDRAVANVGNCRHELEEIRRSISAMAQPLMNSEIESERAELKVSERN